MVALSSPDPPMLIGICQPGTEHLQRAVVRGSTATSRPASHVNENLECKDSLTAPAVELEAIHHQQGLAHSM